MTTAKPPYTPAERARFEALQRVIADTIYFRNKRISGEPQSDRAMHQFETEEANEIAEAVCEVLREQAALSQPAGETKAPQGLREGSHEHIQRSKQRRLDG